jgi:hypothetical protein
MSTAPANPPRPIPESYWVIPGRFLAGEYPALPYSSAGTRQRLAAFLQAEFAVFINLTRPGELEDYTSLLREEAGFLGRTPTCLNFPIGDFGLPEPDQMTIILDAIDQAIAQEQRLYLHCYGGIGRTGTAVGCYLVRHGLTGQQALLTLGEWWRAVPKSAIHPHSPETARQVDFVLNWPAGQ